MSSRVIIGKIWLTGTIVIALYFIWAYLQDNDLHLEQILDARPWSIASAVLTYCGYFLTITITWKAVLAAISNRKVGWVESASHIVLVNFGKYIPGKVWGLAARAARLSELEFTSTDISRASVLEQVLLLLTGLWLALLSASIIYESAIPVILLAVTVITIVMIRNTGSVVEYLSRRIPGAASVLQFVDISVEYRTAARLIIGFTLTWLFLISTFVLVSIAFVDISFEIHTVAVFVLCITSGYLIGFIAIFAPGGIGVREAVGATVLTEIMPIEQGLMFMLLFRVWVVFFELAASLLVVGVKYAGPATRS